VYLAMEGGGAGYVQGGRVPGDASLGSSKQQGPSLPNSESSERVNEIRVGTVTQADLTSYSSWMAMDPT
jgi:hypothetical protein